MPRKFIRVRGGMIFFDFPEDLVAWDNALRRICEKALVVTSKNSFLDEDTKEICKLNRQEFERVFGEGSCKVTFLSDMPTPDAIMDFQGKFQTLLEDWYQKEHASIRKLQGEKTARKLEHDWKRLKKNSYIFLKFKSK